MVSQSAKDESPSKIEITIDKGINMCFIRIPAGSFQMGSPSTEKPREDDELQHKVTLEHEYWFAQFEVTQEQFYGNNEVQSLKVQRCKASS